MEYMRTLPDKAFDLAVVDPPYGFGLADNGGCQGWFAKYQQDAADTHTHTHTPRNRFGGKFDRYKPAIVSENASRGTGRKKA